MKHLVFNVVVIGALAFIFLKDSNVELPFDFMSDSPGQASVEKHSATPAKTVSAGADTSDKTMAPTETLVEKSTAPVASDHKEISEPAEALQQSDERGAVVAQVTPVRSAESDTPEEALPPLAPPVTVSTPVVNTAPSPALSEEKLPAAVSISVAAAEPTKVAPTFMSPKERRRELNRMIEELETFYLDKFTR